MGPGPAPSPKYGQGCYPAAMRPLLRERGAYLAEDRRGILALEADGRGQSPGFLVEAEREHRENGPLDFDEEDPGEQGAALVPWEEVKGSPMAASRMASTGRHGRRRRAADASSRLCGGVGDAPPDAAAWDEQRLGPVKKWVNERDYAGCACCSGHGEWGVRKGSDLEERMSDVSLEEGELRNSGSENEWWERQGRGVSNPVRKSLQVSQFTNFCPTVTVRVLVYPFSAEASAHMGKDFV
ncbi:hypothetical protein NDU88_007298 [Pleurodeles waltl]|uniref:Uncharacterized protein n=1 Tax=Pleurodeles waltl TaxID=8319 RepID=A0AAV7QKB1_PLEWA|nr:hypothetical protein NDU88_007298 [Pleurodeles waltl]